MRNKRAKVIRSIALQIFKAMLEHTGTKIKKGQYYRLDNGQYLNSSYTRLYRKLKRLYSRGLRDQELVDVATRGYKV